MTSTQARVGSSIAAASVALAVLSALIPASAAAVPLIGFNIRGGQYTDVDDWFLGAGVDVDLLMITASPNFEWVFVDGGNLYTLNLDASYKISLAAAQVWAGGGYALRSFKPDGGDTSTKGGVNLFVGGGLGLVPLKPFAQLKYLYVSGADEFVWMVGARF